METETAVVPEEYGKKKYAQFEKYLLLKCLGSGFHAKVKLGLDPETNQKVAIKIFKKTHSLTAVIATMKKEIEIMKALKHKNIVNMIDLVENGTYKKKNGSSYSCFAIVLEYISGGELFEYVSSTGSFKEEVARTYFIQLVKGLTYIHEQGFAHRDLKPENLLFDESYILRIADFGFSTILEG